MIMSNSIHKKLTKNNLLLRKRSEKKLVQLRLSNSMIKSSLKGKMLKKQKLQ